MNRLLDQARGADSRRAPGRQILDLWRNGKPALAYFARVQDERINGVGGDDLGGKLWRNTSGF